jgi:hypothetical protein
MQSEEAPLKVEWERMLPHEFRAAFDALPVVFLPLGRWSGMASTTRWASIRSRRMRCASMPRGGRAGA